MANGAIQHLIVLMLENRSFDHMLGYLDHPDAAYPRLTGVESNPQAFGPNVRVSATADYVLGAGPSHRHEEVIRQLFVDPATGATSPVPINQSFIASFEDTAFRATGQASHGPEIMRCFDPARVPILAKLAKNFVVCTQWFSSVPGETWPNRNFAHAATSHGTYNNETKPYLDKTIFEQLSQAKRSWAIYHDGPGHTWAFPRLWNLPWRHHFKSMGDLFGAIATDQLDDYSFIEPNHGLILNRLFKTSNNQHPENNLRSGRDFLAGEALVDQVYGALLAAPEVFAKTLLVITYDEHGGFFDREPARRVTPPDGLVGKDGFAFDWSGVRVPTVLVSPLVPRGHIDPTFYEHSSIPATVRDLFAPGAGRLTARDEHAASFAGIASLPSPRTDLPPDPLDHETQAAEDLEGSEHRKTLDEFQDSLVVVAEETFRALEAEAQGHRRAPEMSWWGSRAEEIKGRFRSDREFFTYMEHISRHFRSQVDPSVRELRLPDGSVETSPSPERIKAVFAEVVRSRDATRRARLRGSAGVVFTVHGHDLATRTHLASGRKLEMLTEALHPDPELDAAQLAETAEATLREAAERGR
jgi:phospholipase C